MSKLKSLNIRGSLKVSGLEYLNDPGEATQANLKKKNLDDLKLIWSHNVFFNDYIEWSLPVLEALQPPSIITRLYLEGYPGEQYPNWMMLSVETRMTMFPNLTSLTLSHLKRCSNLPSLAGLSQLEYLKLQGMPCLTNCSSYFPSLAKLHLCEMSNLEEVTTMNLNTNNVYEPAFPRLSKLEISGCPKLRLQPYLPPSVVELILEKSKELHERTITYCEGIHALPEGLGELKSLEMLVIKNTPLTSLPQSMQHLSSLRVLTIEDCKGLHALPEWLGELKSLEELVIWNTPLTSLPQSMQHMSSLRELTFCNFHHFLPLLEWLGELKSLEQLTIMGTPLTCLPQSIQHMSSLRILTIVGWEGHNALPEWMGELKSLEQLDILDTPLTCLPESMKHMSSLRELTFECCKGLRVLPEWFGELKSLKVLEIDDTPLTCLPKSMKQLTALESLSIWSCPELERRCEREKGEDWHLISHIPNVHIQ
ncbi:hypothetical protein LUZ63_013089 [Rhynchospora breviuscula]|uniref:Uncharacterized protein n=1 Tax=Rhynchospora breviuscula TaxID=2022672 RepID=A0A9Q0HK84_9POAL|nr:hypothetical protein LUZ63_013089 [Rhynchospora breviuscula]